MPFGTLAGRMDAEPDLRVRLFVNIHRKQRDDTADAVLLREFADTFQHDLWPRQVALKILPEAFSSDPDRLARFRDVGGYRLHVVRQVGIINDIAIDRQLLGRGRGTP